MGKIMSTNYILDNRKQGKDQNFIYSLITYNLFPTSIQESSMIKVTREEIP